MEIYLSAPSFTLNSKQGMNPAQISSHFCWVATPLWKYSNHSMHHLRYTWHLLPTPITSTQKLNALRKTNWHQIWGKKSLNIPYKQITCSALKLHFKLCFICLVLHSLKSKQEKAVNHTKQWMQHNHWLHSSLNACLQWNKILPVQSYLNMLGILFRAKALDPSHPNHSIKQPTVKKK